MGEDIEVRIVSHGLAWRGNIVMIFDIMFLMGYTNRLGYSLLPAILGYLLVGSIIFLAHKIRKSLSYLDFMLNFSRHILVFYTNRWLHFLTPNPVIGNFGIGLAIVLFLVSLLMVNAVRRDSEFLA